MSKRLTSRIAALARAPLAPEMLVPELAIALQRAIGTDCALPVVLLSQPGLEPPHAFRVWRGSETNTDELRGLLQLGVWPGPSTLPSLQRILSEPLPRSVYAAALWGEGCDEEGPWVSLWRDRHVRHGFYLVAFTPTGSAVAVLLSRKPASAAFTPAEVAAGEAVVRFIEAAASTTPAADLDCDAIADEVPIAFAADGRMTSLGLGGPELLRDLGGGGVGARAEGRRLAEAAALRYHAAALANPRAEDVLTPVTAVPAEDAAFMRGHLALMVDGRARAPRVVEIAATSFGAFELQLTASNSVDTGELQVLGVLRRRIPRLLAVVRALVEIDAPGREIELGLQLCSDRSFTEIAAALGVAPASVKTLLTRLGARFATSGREHVVEAMVRFGCRVAR